MTSTHVVATNDKRRFAFDGTGTRIRASQGHSVQVALGYSPATPPDVLFHGTVERFLPAILEQGLRPGRRHAVHLSSDEQTTITVGRSDAGRPVVLRVDAAGDGRRRQPYSRRSANGIWLAEAVPPRYLAIR